MNSVDEHRWSAYIGGVGSGKTHILVIQALREAMIPGTRGLLGAPSYRMLYDVTMKKFFELCPPEWIKNWSVTRMALTLRNDSEILFRSFDNADSLQGHDLDWFGGDEMGLVAVSVFRQMQARLRRPGGRHKGFIVGNPAGPTHWTYHYFVNLAREYPADYNLTGATSYENTFLNAAYTEEMAKSYGKDSLYYRRFVLGEFVAFEGAYWPNFNLRPWPEGHVCTIADVTKILRPRSEVIWNFGRVLDFGFEHPWTLMWWVHDGNTIIFFDEYWKRHSTIREHLLSARSKEQLHHKWFGPVGYSISWTDHDAQGRWEVQNCTDLDGNNIGFECSPVEKHKTVMDSIITVQGLVEQGRLFVTDNCKNALLEIPSYRAKSSDDKGKFKPVKEEPIKEKDDTCDCVRYVSWMELRGTLDWRRAIDKPTDFIRISPTDVDKEFAHYSPETLNRGNAL